MFLKSKRAHTQAAVTTRTMSAFLVQPMGPQNILRPMVTKQWTSSEQDQYEYQRNGLILYQLEHILADIQSFSLFIREIPGHDADAK